MSEGRSNCECGSKTDAPTASTPSALSHGNPGTTLRVTGMDCADEVEAVKRVLKPLSGVRDVRVNLIGGKVVVEHDASITPEQLIAGIEKAGLKAFPDHPESREQGSTQRSRLASVAVSGALTGLGLVAQWSNLAPAPVRIVTFAGAIIAGAWFILP